MYARLSVNFCTLIANTYVFLVILILSIIPFIPNYLQTKNKPFLPIRNGLFCHFPQTTIYPLPTTIYVLLFK